MKKIILAILLITLIVAGGIFALAGKGGRDFSRDRDGFRERIFDRIARDLNLSDEQKTQAKQTLESARSQAEPLIQQVRENRKLIKELGTDGVYDEQKVQELAAAQADLMKQLFIEKEKTKAQLFAVLTPEQRLRAKQKMDDLEGRIGKGGPKGHGPFAREF